MKTAFYSALAAAFVALGSAHAQLPPTQSSGGIPYVSGGFGQDESNAFKQVKSDYSLALTFAVSGDDSGSSPYAGNVQLDLRSKDGKAVLAATSTGPYFLANLEPGTYTLKATFNGEEQLKDVTISAGQTTELKLTWKRPPTGPD